MPAGTRESGGASDSTGASKHGGAAEVSKALASEASKAPASEASEAPASDTNAPAPALEAAVVAGAGLPRREIRDAQTARAMSHPVRIRLVEELVFRGPMTATELAERVGESPANTSWHLRQLARYGFIEEAGGGTGRQRPWRVIVQSNDFGEHAVDTETAAAAQATVDLWITREVEALRAWQRREAGEGEWARAAYLGLSMGWFTLDELRETGQAIYRLLEPYAARIGDPALRPSGSRPVRAVSWGFPADGGASEQVDAGASEPVDAGASEPVDAGASERADAGARVPAGASVPTEPGQSFPLTPPTTP